MNVPEWRLDTRNRALVLIDLQSGITAMPVQPDSAASVVANGRLLADRLRAANALVVLK
ncbi:hypothetical protein P9239_05195 [Caballeronia sp. LZ062]|uniref:hypothetical protein n=1 Tax=unclassified Caballeronia TaxID=2646786 RepID=UPI00285A894C|nr:MULTISPECIES: hypothetical protein [unclassified Caballeronia]MDR5856849.1 hypothetical protein [Caballeronia sp. LZ050]MDR5869754.1 hypothetical protein [Caballeronia sp. LZ062]